MPIVPMADAHAAEVLAIYQAGIDEGDATFETAVPTWETFVAGKLPALRYVAVDDAGRVQGWIAAGPTSSRPCYAGVVEHSVYVAPWARGNGVAGRLLNHLIAVSEAEGIWTIQSSIFPENRASAALHAAAGFRAVGTRRAIAKHHERWRDTLLIERRSDTTGVDQPRSHMGS